MNITNTHFILGTILFVVIMISLTTSCCDFAPYTQSRSSLGMSIYEGLENEDEEEGMKNEDEDEKTKEDKKTKEGLDDEEEGFTDKKEPAPFSSSMFGMSLSGF